MIIKTKRKEGSFMARLNQAENDILPLSALSHPICFVVDMVNGFVKEGRAARCGDHFDLCAPIRRR